MNTWKEDQCMYAITLEKGSHNMLPFNNTYSDKWGFGVIKRWFIGCTSCTLQTLYAWLMRDFGISMVGILIDRVLHLSLRCDSWHASYPINLV